MTFRYYGHACFMVEIAGKKIIFDPFIRPNPLAASIDFASLQADYILLSHAHMDHLADAIDLAKQTNATIVANWEICSWANKNGIEKTHPMNIGGEWTFDFGKVKLVYACHSSSFPDGSYGGTASGFLIHAENQTIYYSGDTSLTADMQWIPQFFGAISTAILPVGNNFTMGYQDACLAASIIKPKQVIGVHFDTFGYIVIDQEKAKNHFKENGHSLVLPGIGEQITL